MILIQLSIRPKQQTSGLNSYLQLIAELLSSWFVRSPPKPREPVFSVGDTHECAERVHFIVALMITLGVVK